MQKASVALPDAFFAGGTPALHVYAFAQDAQGRCSETAYAGVAGFSGEAGVAGFSGDSGVSGLSGVSGFSGETVDTETGEVLAPPLRPAGDAAPARRRAGRRRRAVAVIQD